MGRITVSQAASLLRQAQDILILTHKSPDGDTLGCGFALLRGLQAMGKRARVECSDPITEKFAYLLPESPMEDFEPSYVVAVDIADTSLLGSKLSCWGDQVDLCIDHHPSNNNYAKELLLEDDSAAACEVILEVLDELGITITQEIADCLYTGIATDTGCFKYSNTTVRTHQMAARLMECGCHFQKINERMFETVTRQRMAVEKDALETLEYHFDSRCAIMRLDRDMIERNGASEDDLEGLSSIPRQIEGVEAGVTMKQNKERTGYKISMRTTDKVNASEACMKLGGGGHFRAAGCMITGDFDSAREKILEALKEQF